MTRQDGLSQWTDCVSTNMPHLSKPQATVLALWSFGIACTRSCGRLTVATFLALLIHQKVATIEQRLYEWCLSAPDKAGKKRTSLSVSLCFVPLLAWIVRLWTTQQIALTLDATSLGDRFVVLAVCVVYRGCAIPVASTILEATKKRAWRKEWLRMLRLLRPSIPRDWTVLVLTDRGLYARWLFRRIVRLHWHPFLRINAGCKFRPASHTKSRSRAASSGGEVWRGRPPRSCFLPRSSSPPERGLVSGPVCVVGRSGQGDWAALARDCYSLCHAGVPTGLHACGLVGRWSC